MREKEDMSWGIGMLITLIVFAIPAVLLVAFGLWIGNARTVMGLLVLWTALFLALSVQFKRKRTFTVVERFGYFWDIKFAGPRLIIPWIDNEILQDNFLQKSVPLFKDIEIDFIGGSAPILADGWYQIGNPADFDDGNWGAIREQVKKYTYRVRAEDRPARIADIFQGAFRTFLEQRDIPTAQKEMEDLAREGTKAAYDALKEIGTYPFPGKGIIVRDIVLSPAVIALREQVLKGEMDAREATERSKGYWGPLVEMKKGLKTAKIKLSDKEMMRLFLAQRGFETLQETGSNVTLVASDVDNLQRVITVADVGKGRKGENS